MIQAVHDFGNEHTLTPYHRGEDWEAFFNGQKFEDFCMFSDFNQEWMLKIFNSISDVEPNIRPEITHEVVRLLKKMPLPENVD